jgi:hypothetical protein
VSEHSHYAMLLGSLPYHGPLFGARQTPLSEIRLGQRLALLTPEDLEDVRLMRRLVGWGGLQREDTEVAAEAGRYLPEFRSDFVRDLVDWRLTVRTVVAALRRRHSGQTAPAGRRWGYGRWLAHVQRHWNEPGFRLERVYPWLPEALRQMEQGDAFGLERLLLGVVWDHLERVVDGHYFDFEAVVVYVQRWDLIARWTCYDGATAITRFDALVERGLVGLPDLEQLVV